MQLSGQFTYDADQETVWNLLLDPDVIANALPGVDKFVPLDGEKDAWSAIVKIGVATVRGTYTGTVRISEVDFPSQYRLTVSGEGQQSIVSGTAVMKLTYDAVQQQTVLTWEADAHVSGRLARVGQRLIKAAANLMSKQFFQAVAKQLP